MIRTVDNCMEVISLSPNTCDSRTGPPMELVERIQAEAGLTEEQAEIFRRDYLEGVAPLTEALERMGVGEEDGVLKCLAEQYALPLLQSEDYPEKPMLLDGVSVAFLRKHAVLPLQVDQGVIRVALNDPLDMSMRHILGSYFGGLRIECSIGRREDIRRAIDRLYGAAMREAEEGQAAANGDGGGDEDWERLKGMAQEAPIVRLVNLIISRALDLRASDIHFEPFKLNFRVRCRVDGEMIEIEQPPKAMQAAIVSRLKLMAGLNIAERRLPQDGRIALKLGGRQADIRVSTSPTLFGESVVMRLLSQTAERHDLETLGLSGEQQGRVGDLLAVPHGILLVTGPTGSGKTTTLYAMLRRLNSPSRKIITVEDPVEYQIEGINQIQVKPQIDLTFANALRSLVRQDPDVLLIGEIRDQETAGMAIESALTGHLVLSTLHTNDAPGAVTRLRDLGIESFLIADSLIAVVAQRLVRRLCDECKDPYEASEADVERIRRAMPEAGRGLVLHRNRGCAKCGLTGYRGRLGIFEILVATEPVRSAIVSGADAGRVAATARVHGYAPLIRDGFAKVLAGKTTLSEVLRATSFG
jgi:general secretion pathway protein E